MRIHCTVLLASACVAALPRAASAQSATTPSVTTPSACVSATGPDTGRAPSAPGSVMMRPAVTDTTHAALRILASVSASEVRFVGSPKVCVRLTGDAQLDSMHVTARRNLASPVVSNTTYRNVYVAVEILGRLNAECIAARITGTPADSAATARCASLSATTGAGGEKP